MPARDALAVVFTRAEAAAAGVGPHAVAARVACGSWHRLAFGVFCSAQVWEAAGADEQHRLGAVAASLRWKGAVVSHTSAAALWDLPMPPLAWSAAAPQPLPPGGLHALTWLTVPPSAGACQRSARGVRVLPAMLPDRDVVVWRSERYRRTLSVTSRARTVADCLRHLPAAAAVAFADAAGAAGTSRASILDVLARQQWWPGASAARTAMTLVDPRRETWLESASAVGLVQHGLLLPEPQVELLTPEGRFVARVDDWWAGQAVVGEADGWAKYRARGLTSVGDAERALREEKRREDAIRALRVGVARWSSDDVLGPRRLAATAAAVQQALKLGDPSRVRAVVRSTPLPSGW